MIKLNIILLASGNGVRFGSNKLLHKFRGKELYLYTVTNVLSAVQDMKEYIDNIVIVSKYTEIENQIAGSIIRYVNNENSEMGISHSIHLGIEACRGSHGSYMFFVCDQPELRVETIKKFLTGYILSDKELGCVAYKEILGNPAVFSQKYRQELLDLKGDSGGKKIIKRDIKDAFVCQVLDALELEDIDTPDIK